MAKTKRSNYHLLYIAMFFTGFSGLVLELVAFRMLSISVGTAERAVAIVLASYMTGLGLGTWCMGKLKMSLLDHPKGFVINQICAGFAIIMSVVMLKTSDSFFTNSTYSSLYLLEYCVNFIILLVPSFLLGGSISLLYRVTGRGIEGRGRAIGSVYGWNTAGGVIGVLAATFILVPNLGLIWSSITASGLLFVSVVWYPFRRTEDYKVKTDKKEISGREEKNRKGCSSETSSKSRRLLLSIACISGFSGMALEVLWMRIVSTFLPNRTYSFGIVLAIYLAGFALGSLFVRRFMKGKGTANMKPVFILLGISIWTALTVVFIRLVPDVLYGLRFQLLGEWKQIFVPPLIVSMSMIFPATFLMGMLLPLLISVYKISRSEVGSEVGTLFGANIFASVVGTLIAGFLFIPKIGISRSLLLLSFFYASAGLLYLIYTNQKSAVRKYIISIAAIMLVLNLTGLLKPDLLPKALPVSVFREDSRLDKLLFYKETSAGTISVLEDKKTNVRWSYINNSAVCGTTYDAIKVTKVLAHLPMLAHEDARNVLVIGFGLGVTAGHVLSWPAEKVDCIELCPEITEAAFLYEPYNRKVLSDKRIRVIGGDGRNWLKRYKESYDVITCDPTHPVLGSGNLYTKEFFELVKSRLHHNGIFVQYFPFRYLTLQELKIAMGTFYHSFPHSSLWLGYSHGVMLGSLEPLTINPEIWEQKLNNNPARSDLLRSSLGHVYDWLAILMMNAQTLKKFCEHIEPVSDDKPVLEYPDFASLHPFTWAENMKGILNYRSKDVAAEFIEPNVWKDTQFYAMYDRFFTAKTWYIKGSIERSKGNYETALSHYSKAKLINWDDAEARNVHNYLQKMLGAEKKKRYLQGQ